ncbi:MAG: putative 2,3-bisphosphoglycerate-independent phosphoglycerate mutase [Planctomycetota bacterium]|nr:MAG: putative 2,3-bisphosphoglycerate-independent phosphoglycerate mutase [Planctomycetota bacterium]
MKSLILLPAGLPDVPSSVLDGRTPLEAARTPTLDRWASRGRAGCVRLVPPGLPPGSDTALLALLGVDPRREHPGRGALEALGLGVELGPDDLAFRLSLCSSFDGQLSHPRGGGLRPREARALVESMEAAFGGDGYEFHPGRGYRALLVLRGGADLQIETKAPALARVGALDTHRPTGRDAAELCELLELAEELLASHDVNRVRADLGETPADSLWAWGPGRRTELMPFALRDGRELAVIAQSPLVRGLGLALGAHVPELRVSHDELVTAWDDKLAAARAALDTHDVVLLHIGVLSEASHERDPRLKRSLIEQLDTHLLRPLERELSAREDLRLLITSDHAAPSSDSGPGSDMLPFLAVGSGFAPVRAGRFTEAEAARGDLRVEQGSALLAFLHRSGHSAAGDESA